MFQFNKFHLSLLPYLFVGIFAFDILNNVPENIDIIILSGVKNDDSNITRPFIRYHHNTVSLQLESSILETSSINIPTVTIIQTRSISSFFKYLKEISDVFYDWNSYKYWNSIYILTWPTIAEDHDEIYTLFRNGTFNIQSRRLNLRSNVYILVDTLGGASSIWEIYSIFNITFQNQLKLTTGHGSVNSWDNFTNKISRRSNFRGARITAAAGNDKSFPLESKYTADKKNFESGSAVNRFWFIRDGLNFTERAILGYWTSENENGSLTGTGVQVMRGIVDFGIAQTPVTTNKGKYIDFLQPTDEKTLQIFFVQPAASQYRNIYWVSFEVGLWRAVGLIWIILIVSFRCLLWLKSKGLPGDDRSTLENEFIILAFATATQNGWQNLPSYFHIRIIHFVSHVMALICLTALTGSLVAFLSVKSSPLKSLDQLLNASFRIYSNSNTTPIAYAMPILQAQPGYPKDVLKFETESIPKSRTTGNGLITFAYVLYVMAKRLNYTDEMLCSTFDSLPVLKVPLFNAMIVRKGSPYKEFFNHQIILMIERGFNHRYKTEYKRGTEISCLDFSQFRHTPLGFNDVMSAPLILLIGLSLSFLCLLIERIIFVKLPNVIK